MKKTKNRLLSIILILSFILPLFAFERKVEASTEPVGIPWVTATYDDSRIIPSIQPIGVSGNNLYYKDHGKVSWNYETMTDSFVRLSLGSNGGEYEIIFNQHTNSNFNIDNGVRGFVEHDYQPNYNYNNDSRIVPHNSFILGNFAVAVGTQSHGGENYYLLVPINYLSWADPYTMVAPNRLPRLYFAPSSETRSGKTLFINANTTLSFAYGNVVDNNGKWTVGPALLKTIRSGSLTSSYMRKLTNPRDLFYNNTNGTIYITENTDSNNSTLLRLKLDGTYIGTTNLQFNNSLYNVNNKYGYLIFDSFSYYNKPIIRTKLDGSQETSYPLTNNGRILYVSDNYIYYHDYTKTYRQHIEHMGINELVFNFVPSWFYTKDDDVFFYKHPSYLNIIYKHVLNDPPELTLNTPLNSTESANYYVKEEGLSTITVSGSVRDINNDTLTVTASLGGVTKSTTITNTATAKTFNFAFDVITDNIPDGTHALTVTATDPKGEKAPNGTRTIIIKGRVRHNDFVLVDSSLVYSLLYQDEENDPKFQEQFRYVHNPNYFKNPIGVISDSNTWRNGLYNKLALPGHYKITYRARDNPKNIASFDEFRMWSRESLSEINLYVHRKPIAIFKATANTSGTITVTNFTNSYDPDHQGEVNNGIIARQWRWKNINSPTWTTGSNPPTSLPANQDYIIALRVRDIDGIGGVGVWGDWTEINLSTGPLAPLNALFTLNPSIVSHSPSKTITTTNLSSGPITKYEWIIRKGGVQQGSIISTSIPTSAQLKAYGIGKFTLQLRVGDATRWSEPYTLAYEVMNNPPIASFEAPSVVYRDTNIVLTNTTQADLDGDTITYQWKLKQPNGTEYNISTAQNPVFKVQSIISTYNINPISAISKNWEIKLIATDAKGAKSEYTKDLEVINNVPEAKINGPVSVKQYTAHSYVSNDTDADTGDNPLNIFRWKHTKPDGSYEGYTTKDITLTFNDHGSHAIEHYVIDRIGDKSNIAILNVDVEENQAPSMTITSPSGTSSKPTVIPGDPLMKWIYTDPENDPQEKYSFDFYYADDDILERSFSNDDTIGNTREYQMPNNTFERFRTIKAVGRSFSKYRWSELSNEVYFIINDAPTGGFDFNKDPAEYVRNEEIKVTGFGDDPNIENGDSITFKYYLKKLPSGSETLISSEKDLTHIINSLTLGQNKDNYQIRQVITDSLGFTAPEVIKTFTINNQKPIVEIIEPSSSNSNDPTLISEVDLKPTIRWDYSDADGDSQKKYKVTIYNGSTNNMVTSSGEIASENKHWIVPNPLVEDVLYSVLVEVYDGHEWSISERKYFKVFSLKIEGYLLPNPAMAGDKIYFYITTEGFADKIEIVVPDDLIAMDNRVSMGYPAVTYPSIFFNVDKNVMKKEDILDYIAWVSTPDTLNKDNVRLRQPYKFIVRAYKGTVTREIELDLDIKGSILELLKPGIKNKNGK